MTLIELRDRIRFLKCQISERTETKWNERPERQRKKNRQADRRTGCSKVLSCDWQSMPVEISRVHTDKQTNISSETRTYATKSERRNVFWAWEGGGRPMESAMFAWIQTIIYKLTDILSYATIYYRYKLYCVRSFVRILCMELVVQSVGVFRFYLFRLLFPLRSPFSFYGNDTHFLFLALLVLLVLNSQFSYCLTHIRRRTLDWTPTNAISMDRF